MDTSDIVWLVVGLLVLLALAALAYALLRKRRAQHAERDRTRAGQLRREAAAHATGVAQSEQQAAAKEAQARQVRLEAERAEQEAERARTSHQMQAATYEDRLREADRLDPDVDTSSQDYHPGERAIGPDDLPGDGASRVR